MAEVIVNGSKNNFGFGPVQLQIVDGLESADEAHAVLDAILHADRAEDDELTMRRVVREESGMSGRSIMDLLHCNIAA